MPYPLMHLLFPTVGKVMRSGTGIALAKEIKTSEPFTIKITEKTFNTSNLNPCSKQRCLIQNNGPMFLKDRVHVMLCSPLNTTKVIVYGTVLKQTVIGDVHGTQ